MRGNPWVVPFLIAFCWQGTGAQAPSRVFDLDGAAVDPFAASAAATVLIFVRTDCPIANQAAPEIERLRRRFEPEDVRFWLVYVDPDQPAAAVRAHLDEYQLGGAAVQDPGHVLVARAGARVTPEAALFVRDPAVRLVYRGRLDNRYASPGRARPQATRRDLELALEAVLAGSLRDLTITPAVGCEIADLR